jgi:addiction module RelB/DinJ family antitoxin
MNTTFLHVQIERVVKQQAQKTADELGLTLSAVVKVLLKQFIRTRQLSVGVKESVEIPNAYFREAIKRARENRKQGKGSPIFTDEKELIKKDPRKYQHIDTMMEWLHKQGV